MNCQIVYEDEHVADDWTPYTKPQPNTGQFWVGIKELVRGWGPKVKVTCIPEMCHHSQLVNLRDGVDDVLEI